MTTRRECLPCDGIEARTPESVANRPGLPALRYRVGRHGTILETMQARLSEMYSRREAESRRAGGTPECSQSASRDAAPAAPWLHTRELNDPSIALLDAWATVGDVLTFYQERIANEGYLGTALERRSLTELARHVGYELRPALSASVYLAFDVQAPPSLDPDVKIPSPHEVKIPKGTQAKSSPLPGELPVVFETTEDLIARPEWNVLKPRMFRPKIIDDSSIHEINQLRIERPETPLRSGDMLLIETEPLYSGGKRIGVPRQIATVTPEPLSPNLAGEEARSYLTVTLLDSILSRRAYVLGVTQAARDFLAAMTSAKLSGSQPILANLRSTFESLSDIAHVPSETLPRDGGVVGPQNGDVKKPLVKKSLLQLDSEVWLKIGTISRDQDTIISQTFEEFRRHRLHLLSTFDTAISSVREIVYNYKTSLASTRHILSWRPTEMPTAVEKFIASLSKEAGESIINALYDVIPGTALENSLADYRLARWTVIIDLARKVNSTLAADLAAAEVAVDGIRDVLEDSRLLLDADAAAIQDPVGASSIVSSILRSLRRDIRSAQVAAIDAVRKVASENAVPDSQTLFPDVVFKFMNSIKDADSTLVSIDSALNSSAEELQIKDGALQRAGPALEAAIGKSRLRENAFRVADAIIGRIGQAVGRSAGSTAERLLLQTVLSDVKKWKDSAAAARGGGTPFVGGLLAQLKHRLDESVSAPPASRTFESQLEEIIHILVHEEPIHDPRREIQSLTFANSDRFIPSMTGDRLLRRKGESHTLRQSSALLAQMMTQMRPDEGRAFMTLLRADFGSRSRGRVFAFRHRAGLFGSIVFPKVIPKDESPGNAAQDNSAQGDAAQGNAAQGNAAQGNAAQGNMGGISVATEPPSPEHPRELFLDNDYSDVAAGGRCLIAGPETDGAVPSARRTEIDSEVPGIPIYSPFEILEATAIQRTSSGQHGRSTWALLDSRWRREDGGHLPDLKTIRSTIVHIGSVELPLAEERIEEFVPCDFASDLRDQLELSGFLGELRTGATLLITGESVVMDPASKAPRETGITVTRTVKVVAVVDSGTSDNRRATKAFATVVIDPPLDVRLKRDTVRIYANVVQATHGETQIEILGSGEGQGEFQQFSLSRTGLTHLPHESPTGMAPALTLRVNGVEWTRGEQPDDMQSSSSSLLPARYLVRVNDDDGTVLRTGDGKKLGERLPTGIANVIVQYRVGGGQAGNVREGAVTQLPSPPLNVTKVRNLQPASGGVDREGIEQARSGIPIASTALDRLVSLADYESFARKFAGIAKAQATLLTLQGRATVVVTVAALDDAPLGRDSLLFRNLEGALRRHSDPDQEIVLLHREQMLLLLRGGVRIDPRFLWDSVRSEIVSRLVRRFSFENARLAEDVLLGEVIAEIQAVEGVRYVDIDAFDRMRQFYENADMIVKEASFAATVTPTAAVEVAGARERDPDISEIIVDVGTDSIEQALLRSLPETVLTERISRYEAIKHKTGRQSLEVRFVPAASGGVPPDDQQCFPSQIAYFTNLPGTINLEAIP